jgi:hypothetical protein
MDVLNLKSEVFISLLYFLKLKEEDGTLSTVMRLMGLTYEESWFDSQLGKKNYLISKASRSGLGATQPPFQWVSWILSLQIHQIG